MEEKERPDILETFWLFRRGIIKMSSGEELKVRNETFGQNMLEKNLKRYTIPCK